MAWGIAKKEGTGKRTGKQDVRSRATTTGGGFVGTSFFLAGVI